MSVESSLDRYRGLFNALPTPAWEEDFSGVWRVLQARGLVGQPADAVRAALDAEPQLLEECIAAVRILDVNDEAVRLHRARDKQVLLAGLGQVLVEESREAIIAQLVALAGNGNALALDSVVRTLDGVRRDVHLSWAVVPGEGVPFSRVVVSTQDITARRSVEAEAERERALNQAAIESLPGLFYMFDATGRFVRWNRNFEVTSEYGPAVAEMSPLDFFAEPERSLVATRIAEVFTKGESSVEASFRTKSGKAIPHFFTGRRVVFGDRTCVVGMGVDLSQHKQLEEQLRQSQKMDAIGQLAGGIAHDFNNLLTIIQASTDVLATAREPTQRDELLEEIVNATGRAAGLTRQLLAFSRGQKLERRPADLNALVSKLSQLLRRIVGEDVKLTLSTWTEALPIHVDEGLLDQALMNLVVNARHAMPDGGTLSMETLPYSLGADERGWAIEANPGPYVCVRVVDTGTGIAPAHLPHIFEPFFTTREVGSGTGLGLAMVFGIVRQHGGTLRVDSEVGRGTRFELLLPAQVTPAEPETSSNHAAAVQGQGSEAILVVEDEDRLRAIVTRVLTGKGYRVLAAGSGPEALQLWQQQGGAFDLLLTDMRLPDGMSGADIATRLCAEKPALPVLYMSGYLGGSVSPTLDLREGDNFLAKPFTPAELLSLVRRRLDSTS